MSFHWQEGAMRGRGDVFPLAGGCNERAGRCLSIGRRVQ